MKRIILSILSVFITLGAAAETGQALPAVQRAATAAVEEPPSGNEDTVPPETSDTPGTGTEATAETTSGLAAETDTAAAAGTLGALAASPATMPAAMPAEKHKRPQVERFLPTRRRIDREINKLKFAYKGEVMMGLTASYGTVSSDDTDLMLIFDNIDADATIATVKPFVGYCYRDNNCIGIRFGYSHMGGTLDNTYFDAGEGNDLSGQLPYVDLSSDEYSFGIFHRSYAGLDPKGRFGLFAEFELAVNQMTERGEGLTADALCDIYRKLNADYFGPDIVLDEEISLEGARIPHFYYNYYVFQYATGYSAAIALSRRILREGAPAVKDYLGFLSGGCSKSPIDLLKGAGVDMTSPEPVNQALALFGELLDEMEALTRE